MDDCPFCLLDKSRLIAESAASVAFFDNYPISEGHTLVASRRHVSSIYELLSIEQSDLWKVVADVRTLLIARFGVESFNIGFNEGLHAGQTVPHAHIHIIPRRAGDVPDPRGGVRWIIADKAKYWD